MRAGWWTVAVGVASAGAALAVAEAATLLVAAEASPLPAVGALAIELAPPGVKDLMIGLFGTADKLALLILLAVVATAGAALAGALERRRPPWGVVLFLAAAIIPVIATTSRAGASGLWAVPTVVGFAAGALLLHTATRLLNAWQRAAVSDAAPTSAPASAPSNVPELAPAAAPLQRRQFLGLLLLTVAASAVVGLGARVMGGTARAVDAARAAIRLPRPAVPEVAAPTDADLKLTGLSPYQTPNSAFYRIDTALQVPQVNAADWKLRIIGRVEREVEISYAELLALPLVEHSTTLVCVSNEVGGDLIGNAVWLGYPIRDLLTRARPVAGADMVLSRSVDGWTASTPLEALQDPARQALLAVGMNGEPLPVQHGFPVRMVVPGLYGYVSATKWVTELKVTRFDDEVAFWTPRGWSARGPVKTSSRIEVPRPGAVLPAGPTVLAGTAWAQHTGIDRVEVRVDDGPWRPATLGGTVGVDTWRQWSLPWTATTGSHRVSVRATDSSGYTQTEQRAAPAPDGATGWHTVTVSVR